MRKKPFDILGFHESVRRDFRKGLLTLDQAALEFYKGGWTRYIDIKYAKKHCLGDGGERGIHGAAS